VLELDTLSAILPMDRRDRLGEILTDDDVETLKHLAREGWARTAFGARFAYLEAWELAATASPLPWPVPEALALKFVVYHLWDPAQRESNPNHGMPAGIADFLRAEELSRVKGPHAPAAVPAVQLGDLHHRKGATGPSSRGRCVRRSGLRCAPRQAADPEEQTGGHGRRV